MTMDKRTKSTRKITGENFPNKVSFTSFILKKKHSQCLKEHLCSSSSLSFLLALQLMNLLSCDDKVEIITWLPHGKSFIFLDQKRFVEEVMPMHFGKCKFASFSRKLYRWGFRQITKGPDAGSYFHTVSTGIFE